MRTLPHRGELLSWLRSSFILGLRGLSHPETARRGMHLAEFGMLMAIIGTLMHQEIVSYEWIIAGLLLGSAIGTGIGLWVPMTAMPQRTAFSHAFGAFAAALVGVSEYSLHGASLSKFTMGAIGFDVLLGSLTTTGSLIAFAKLQGMLPGRPLTYKGQNIFNLSLLGVIILAFVFLIFHPGATPLFYVMVILSLVFGVLLVMPIGSADMPVVIALLNAYAGLGIGCHWLCHFQQRSDYRRHAGRGFGIHPLDRHVQGDEPLDYRGALRRVRKSLGSDVERGRRHDARSKRRGPRRATGVRSPGLSLCRATAWRPPRRNTPSGNFPPRWKRQA